MQTRTDTSAYKICEFVSKQAPGTELEPRNPPADLGVKRVTWGVMLSQLDGAGVIKSTGWHKPYATTEDSTKLSPLEILDLWRIASKTNKSGRSRKDNRSQAQPKEPEPPPPPEEIEIDIIDFLRRLLRTGNLNPLLEAAKLEYGTPPEEQSKASAAEEQMITLERKLSEEQYRNSSLHAANTKLREELFNERRKMQDLRAQLATASSQTKVIEKIIKVGAIPPGTESGGSGGGRVHAGSGHSMRMHKKPHVPTPGGMVTVIHKKKH